MHTSSSAKRTCRLSRSASEYTATVWMPSSRQARITRSAISPRLAIRTFLNMSGGRRPWVGWQGVAKHEGGVERGWTGARSGVRVVLERVPARVARARDALHAQGELARVGGVEDRVLVADRALRVPRHER